MEVLKPTRVRHVRPDGRMELIRFGDAESYPVASAITITPSILITAAPGVSPQVIVASITKV